MGIQDYLATVIEVYSRAPIGQQVPQPILRRVIHPFLHKISIDIALHDHLLSFAIAFGQATDSIATGNNIEVVVGCVLVYQHVFLAGGFGEVVTAHA